MAERSRLEVPVRLERWVVKILPGDGVTEERAEGREGPAAELGDSQVQSAAGVKCWGRGEERRRGPRSRGGAAERPSPVGLEGA